MTLALYFHPLASFCWKALIALYENETPFEPHVIDLGDDASRAKLAKLWPMTKFPVLHDRARDQVVPESSILIEYLAQHYPGPSVLLPTDRDLALLVRQQDRFYDVYVHERMQTIVGDRIRPEGAKDPYGVADAKRILGMAYDIVEDQMSKRTWAAGETYTMADCAASPALHYANRVLPFDTEKKRPHTAAYLARLEARPSFTRVLAEAAPYAHMFPG